MKTFKKLKKGFTLVELVVVIAVIAILAAVSVGAYFGVTESANNSKLEQEAKQVYTAIQTVALAPNDYSSLSKDGLMIIDAGEFETALEDNLGIDVALTDVQDTKDSTKPTIYFVAPSVTPVLGGTTVYSSFEYYSHEIGGKRAVADVVTGEVNVENKTDNITEIKPSPISISLAEANEIGEAQENDKYTEQEYILEGQITSISHTTYGNMTINEGETSFYLYGLYQNDVRYDAMTEKPNVGDFVRVLGTLGNHNGTAQIKNAQLISWTEGEIPTSDPIEISLEDANTIGLEQSNNAYTVQQYILEGDIVEITDSYHGNMTITDGTNNFVIYGTYKEGTKYGSLTEKPVVGDAVVVCGVIGNYNGTAQMKDAELVEFTKSEVPAITSIPEALLAADGTAVVLTGEVVKIETPYSEQHDNISVTIEDAEDNRIYIFRLSGQVQIHDNITVSGAMTTYETTNQRQVENGTYLKNGVEECSYADATCIAPKTCTICGNTDGVALGHAELDTDGNCTRCHQNPSIKEVTVILSEYATANNWTVSTSTSKVKYLEVNVDENVTVTITGGTNSGQYWSDGWRLYATDTPAAKITIAAKEGYSLSSVTVNTVTGGTYADLFLENTEEDIKNTKVEVSGETVVLNTVKNGTDGKQIRVTSITVGYVIANNSEEPEIPVTPEHTEHTFDSTGACTYEGCTVTCTHNWENKDGECSICHYICNHTLEPGATCEVCNYKAPSAETEEPNTETKTVTKTMEKLRDELGYTARSGDDQTFENESSIVFDDNVNLLLKSGSWRFWAATGGTELILYQTKGATFGLLGNGNVTINSVTLTFTIKNSGKLDGFTSNSPYSVNDTSFTKTVENTGTKTNGQIKITAISVTYTVTK